MEQQEIIQFAVGAGAGVIGGIGAGLALRKMGVGIMGGIVIGLLAGAAAAYGVKALGFLPPPANPPKSVDVPQLLTIVGAGIVAGGVLTFLASLLKGKPKK